MLQRTSRARQRPGVNELHGQPSLMGSRFSCGMCLLRINPSETNEWQAQSAPVFLFLKPNADKRNQLAY
jgi:hypothetical protein